MPESAGIEALCEKLHARMTALVRGGVELRDRDELQSSVDDGMQLCANGSGKRLKRR